ncbi:MAG: TonB-dependent receptor [Steroidobacteraceae bacterium]
MQTGFAARCAAYATILGLTALAAPALAQEQPSAEQPALATVVVQATAIPGASIDADKVPGTVQSLSAADLSREGDASLTTALESQLGSINIDDNLDDPYQPDILYRGFEGSPVLGTPEGLAVYQNGVRINEAFGDTVNWDLIPDLAIDRVDVVSSNPVYGLNALGAGVSVTMKNGFNYGDGEAELMGGSFGMRSADVEYGTNNGLLGFYVAGKALDQTGWREFSPNTLRQLYTAFSLRTDRASLDLSYALADNWLQGQGAAPVQELAINRSLVFTGPQNNVDRLNFVTLNGSLKVTDTLSLQSVAYYRQYQQNVSNGNTTNYTECTAPGESASLCQTDGATPVTNAAGMDIPDISQGGSIPIGENDFESISAYGRGVALQATDHGAIFGHDNEFSVGTTLDYARADFYSGTQIGVINSQLIVESSNLFVDTPEDSPAGIEFGATPVDLQSLNKYFGAYVTDTFDVTPAFSLTASGRYNLANIDLEDQLGTDLTGNNRYTHFNPAIGGTYKILPAMTAYVGFTENNRTPTASEIECSNPLQPCLLPSNLAGDPPTLRQVIAHTFEAGLRGTVHATADAPGALSWNVDVFRTNLDNDIYGIATSVSSGFFANIGSTRRQGVEAGLDYHIRDWSAYFNYSYIAATFESPLVLPSPSNPFQDENGNIEVNPGDRLPGIPQHRLKTGLDYKILPQWTAGASLVLVSDQYFFGDESNQLAPMPGYHVVELHSSYTIDKRFEIFASIDNLLNAKYATYGILSDPTGIGAPGIPPDGVTNGPGVDNRFESPAAPFSIYGGFRIDL